MNASQAQEWQKNSMEPSKAVETLLLIWVDTDKASEKGTTDNCHLL